MINKYFLKTTAFCSILAGYFVLSSPAAAEPIEAVIDGSSVIFYENAQVRERNNNTINTNNDNGSVIGYLGTKEIYLPALNQVNNTANSAPRDSFSSFSLGYAIPKDASPYLLLNTITFYCNSNNPNCIPDGVSANLLSQKAHAYISRPSNFKQWQNTISLLEKSPEVFGISITRDFGLNRKLY